MKIIRQSITALVILVMSMMTISAQSQNQWLIGRWVVDFDKSIQSLEGAPQEKYDKMSSQGKSLLKKTLSSQEMSLLEDGTASIQIEIANAENRVSTGTWTYDLDSNTLSIVLDDQLAKYYISWEGNKKILLEMTESSPDTFLKKIYYKKK